jgi:hypothetical protein
MPAGLLPALVIIFNTLRAKRKSSREKGPRRRLFGDAGFAKIMILGGYGAKKMMKMHQR